MRPCGSVRPGLFTILSFVESKGEEVNSIIFKTNMQVYECIAYVIIEPSILFYQGVLRERHCL